MTKVFYLVFRSLKMHTQLTILKRKFLRWFQTRLVEASRKKKTEVCKRKGIGHYEYGTMLESWDNIVTNFNQQT